MQANGQTASRKWNLHRAIWLAAISFGLVAGCTGEPINKSAESELLRTEVVPQLLAWAKSDSQKLELGRLNTLQDFDHVCSVWEYQDYSKIEALAGPIASYFGSYRGGMVPENQTAFVGVRAGSAHVAHMRKQHLQITGKEPCVEMNRSRLIKVKNKWSDAIAAKLENN